MIQYLDKDGNAGHMNMVVGTNKDGKSMKVYNAYNQKIGQNPIYDQLLTGNRTATAQDGVNDNFVVYRPTEAALKSIDQNSDQTKKGLANYDTQNKYQAVRDQLSGMKTGTDNKLTFILKSGKEVKSSVTTEQYRVMDKSKKTDLFQSILNKK